MMRAVLGAILITIMTACATKPDEPPKVVESASASAAKKNCMQTGSHVRTTQGACTPAPGRSHSSGDIQRTGAGGTAEALKVLNPAVDIHKE